MKLRVTTPLELAVDVADVRHVRGEDASGAFGIQAHHASFVTILEVSVVTWLDSHDVEHHVAVRGGVLSVCDAVVEIATREAVAGDDLSQLEHDAIARFRREEQVERTARGGATRLETATIQRLYEYIRGERPRHEIGREDDHGNG